MPRPAEELPLPRRPLSRGQSAAFSPDGERIVTASDDNTAKVWDAHTGDQLLTLDGHKGASTPRPSAPMGSASSPPVTTTRPKSGMPRAAKHSSPSPATPGPSGLAAFSPDGDRIVTASSDNTAKVWDAQTGQEILTLAGHAGSVSSAAFSPDGTRIVTASADNTAKVWDATDGQEILTLAGHSDSVRSAAFSPDGTLIVTASSDNTAKVWDATERHRTPHPLRPRRVRLVCRLQPRWRAHRHRQYRQHRQSLADAGTHC